MADCDHNCENCSADCEERSSGIEKAPMNRESNVRKVIGVISGKGGVGKSSVTSLLASSSRRKGRNVAILDADITGPSIPNMFGRHEMPLGTEDQQIIPIETASGIEIMSTNLLLEDGTDPVVWRGPLLGSVIQQFWSDVIWGDIDVMYVDMPPGTGDVALTVYQQLPVDGIVVVTSPQQLVSVIVEKAVKMSEMMNIPILGIVENMSYFKCPNCGAEHKIFGESHISDIALKYDIRTLACLPIDPEVAALCDTGEIEAKVVPEIDEFEEKIVADPVKVS